MICLLASAVASSISVGSFVMSPASAGRARQGPSPWSAHRAYPGLQQRRWCHSALLARPLPTDRGAFVAGICV